MTKIENYGLLSSDVDLRFDDIDQNNLWTLQNYTSNDTFSTILYLIFDIFWFPRIGLFYYLLGIMVCLEPGVTGPQALNSLSR